VTRKSDAGQALMATTLALGVVIGFVGLGIDVGMLRYEKRLQQTAADAAAIAGASNLCRTGVSCGPYGGVSSGAQNASATNGFADNTGNGGSCWSSPAPPPPPPDAPPGWIEVTVCNPPQSGPHTGDRNYVEAFVTAVQPTYFIKALPGGPTKTTVTARAVATNVSGGSNGGCLYTLGLSPSGIGTASGSGTLNASTCGVVDNGDFNTGGSALNLTAGTFGISGTSYPGGSVSCAASSTCPTLNMPASSDPLSYLTPPCSPCTDGIGLSISSDTAVGPGTYTSISISGGMVTFALGTYIIDGSPGFSCNVTSGTSTITGSGVTFYFTNGATFNCSNNVSIQLSAPTSGPYAGILMYQDPNDTAGPSLGGDDRTSFQGALYFPKAQLTFVRPTTSINGYSIGIVVADSLQLTGNPTVKVQGSAALPAGVNPIWNAALVE